MAEFAAHPEDEYPLTDSVSAAPASVEAEQAVLGGLMIDNKAWDEVAGRIAAKDFTRPDHRLIFAATEALSEASSPSDPVTVAEYLTNKGEIGQTGGLPYLQRLAQDTPSAANILAYADIVRERALLRELIEVGNDIARSAYNPDGKDGKTLVDQAEQKVFEIAERGKRRGSGFTPLRSVLGELVDEIDKRHQNPGAITGLSTGWKKFDEQTSGLQNGDLIIVAGRPSMGKTTLAINMAENIAFKPEDPRAVAVFSMEMGVDQLALRMVASIGRVNHGSLRNGGFDPADWPRINGAIQQMREAPVFIDDTPGLTPSDLRARARRLQRENGNLGLIVVDYLQLMTTGGGAENRATEISEISRSLKALARELNVPVIALSQLNRSVEQRPDKRPVMSDLRESGAIEQDADLIVFIYRDKVYNPDTERQNAADIIIAKQRNGPIGTVELTFLGQFSRFENYSPELDVPHFGGPPL